MYAQQGHLHILFTLYEPYTNVDMSSDVECEPSGQYVEHWEEAADAAHMWLGERLRIFEADTLAEDPTRDVDYLRESARNDLGLLNTHIARMDDLKRRYETTLARLEQQQYHATQGLSSQVSTGTQQQ